MSRYGDEMVAELANLLNKHGVGLDKTAAKKEDKEDKKEDKKDEKCEKCGKDPCKCKEMKEKEDEKKEKKEKAKKKKKAEFMSDVLNNLVKLAEELDAAGADEAASLVDDALKIIVKNIKEDEKKN